MRFSLRWVALPALVSLVVACSNSGTVGKSEPGVPKLAGKWESKAAPAQASKDEVISIPLDFSSEESYTMRVLGLPVAGSVARSGNDLTLNPETIAGLTFEEAKKAGMNATIGNKPIKGSISDDGSTLTLVDETADGKVFTFVRKPELKIEEKVSAADRGLVGVWQGQANGVPDTLKGQPKDQQDLIVKMMKNTSIELRPDYSFALNLVVEMQGTWSAKPDGIHLKVESVTGLAGDGMSGDDVVLKVEDGGSRLVLNDVKTGMGKVEFRKQ